LRHGSQGFQQIQIWVALKKVWEPLRHLSVLQLCKDMNSTHGVLFHTSVRWLSKGNVSTTVCAMKDGTKLFLERKTNEFLSYISDKVRLKSRAYLAEIFEKLNNLNLRLQGKVTNII